MHKSAIPIILLLFYSTTTNASTSSTCYGTTDNGRIENAWELPTSGDNFRAYSLIGITLGRNYVHSDVYEVVVNAYKELKTSEPNMTFVYGETGLKNGGKFSPHKTHQNGLSVDFFVPIINTKTEKPDTLPTGVATKFGYSIEFDTMGRYKDYTIDFDAMAQHIIQLKTAADKQNIKIKRVIFDNDLQKLLFQSPTGKQLPGLVTFSTKKPWVRHDEHYHIDFDVPCKKM
jgi:penicillin-insensitive murein endopeptidase